MRSSVKGAIVLVWLVTLAGCATVPSVPYDRSSANVESIAVVGLKMPEHAIVYQAARIGESFGLIGELVEAGIQANRESRFNKLLGERGFDAQSEMVKALVYSLTSRGYYVSQLEAPRERNDYLKNYPTPPEDVQALLDLVVWDYGYMQAGPGKPWRPELWLKCRLVRSTDHSVLMESIIEYNALNEQEGVVSVSPDESYAFKNVDKIVGDGDHAIDGLLDAISRTADAIATLLQ